MVIGNEDRTPPKARSNQLGSGKHTAIDANSNLRKMHDVHFRLSRALEQVGGMMDIANRLYSTNQLSTDETKRFTSAMAEMTECVEEWQGFFGMAAQRSSLLEPQDALIDLNDASLSGSGDFDSLQDGENAGISSSPLVPCKSQPAVLFPLTPLHRPLKGSKRSVEATATVETDSLPGSLPSFRRERGPWTVGRTHTPQLPGIEPAESPAPDDLLTQAPASGSPAGSAIPSSQHPEKIKGSSPHSVGCSVSTPPQLRQWTLPSPESMDLITPKPPADFLVKYPRTFGTAPNMDPSTPFPETPTFGKSPPRTCRPLRLLENGSFADADLGLQTNIATPYATPGSVFSPVTPFTISKSSLPLVDDMTTSAIQRVGEKGLEEELWRKMMAWNIDKSLAGGAYTRSRLSRRASTRRHAFDGKENNV